MDVAAWLRQLGLGNYAETFAAHDIDASVLPDITAEDLIALGITSIGHRRKLLGAIAALQVTASHSTVEPTRGPERRHLTVMFVDLAGSTQLSQRLDPEEMAALLRAYHNLVAGEISRFEGFTAKLMGDGVLAYFGWPRTHEDEAERAARAGLAIVQAVRGLNVPKAGPLACRVGIATGLVVVGDRIGEACAQEEAVIGETPNLAARLQQLAEAHGVVVSAGTRRLLPDSLKIVPLGPRRLRGLSERVDAFAVTGERPASTRFETRSGATDLPMFGRDQELALLLERWARAKAGDGQAVLLVGEAGIGKSRICQALVDALAAESYLRIRYQCSPYHADSPFWPTIQQLRHAIGVDADDSRDGVLDRLEALLGQGLDDPSSAAPYIASLIGIDGVERYGQIDGAAESRRSQTLQILGDQLAGLARKTPVLVLVEDAHWIDPSTRELIEQAIETIADVPVLVLMTTRPDNQPALAAHPHVTRLTLNRLARDGAAAIVSRISATQPLSSDVLETILARTDGVPLFVEEMTKAVVETGLPAVPSSLHDSLMARLDRGPQIKEIAQVAACIGRTFDYDLLAQIAGRTADELGAGLGELAAAELVLVVSRVVV